MQGIKALPAEAYPCRIREIAVHHCPQHGHRQCERRLLLPGHLLDGEACGGLGEDGAAKEHADGNLALVERLEILGRSHLEIVGAGQRQVDLGAPGEALHHQRHLRPHDGLKGLAPAPGLSEELEQAIFLLAGVATAPRLDLDLASERDGVEAGPGRLRDAQLEREGGRGMIWLGPRPDHFKKDQRAHHRLARH